MSTTRVLAVLLLCAAASSAEPLIGARGESLAAFDVDVKLDLSAATPTDLAGTFSVFRRELESVNARWVRLFRREHLAILARYYTPEMVARQRAQYDRAAPDAADCTLESCDLAGQGKARAILKWTRRGASIELLLTMKKKGARWFVQELHRKRGAEWVKAGLGLPPKGAAVEVPPSVKPDRSSAKAAIASLERDIRRLALLGNRARLRLHRHHRAILQAFYGDTSAARPAPKPGDARIELAKPKARIGDVVRVEAVLTEPVPGTEKRSAIAHAAFDLRPGKDGWRVVAEHMQPNPDAPFQPAPGNYAMLLIMSAMR